MTTTAVILAPDDKGVQTAFSLPTIRRLALMTTQAGLSVHLIGATRQIVSAVSDLIVPQNVHHAENAESMKQVLLTIPVQDDEKVLILLANHVIDRHSLKQFIEAGENPGIYHMGGTASDAIGSIWLIPRENLPSPACALWTSRNVDTTVTGKAHRVACPEGLPYLIGEAETQSRVAEDRLIAALAFQTAADDGFFSRHFDRKISRFISGMLVRTPVTPNMITLAGMTIGLSGAYLLSLPGYRSRLLGALLFLFCIIVDGVDGEVARLKLKESTFGHYLDVITDNIVHLFIFIAIGVGLYRETGEILYIRALWFMLGGFVLCLVAVYQCILRKSPEELEQSPKMLRLMALLTNRDFAYLVAALAVLDRLNWFLLGASAGTYLFALTLWTLNLYEKRGRRPAC